MTTSSLSLSGMTKADAHHNQYFNALKSSSQFTIHKQAILLTVHLVNRLAISEHLAKPWPYEGNRSRRRVCNSFADFGMGHSLMLVNFPTCLCTLFALGVATVVLPCLTDYIQSAEPPDRYTYLLQMLQVHPHFPICSWVVQLNTTSSKYTKHTFAVIASETFLLHYWNRKALLRIHIKLAGKCKVVSDCSPRCTSTRLYTESE